MPAPLTTTLLVGALAVAILGATVAVAVMVALAVMIELAIFLMSGAS